MPDTLAVAQSLSPVERKLLPFLKPQMTLVALLEATGFPDAEVKRGLMWLENHAVVNVVTEHVGNEIDLNDRGRHAKEHGLPEQKIMQQLTPQGLSMQNVFALGGKEMGAALGQLKKERFVEVTPDKKVVPGPRADEFASAFPLPKILAELDFPVRQEVLETKGYAQIIAASQQNSASSLFTQAKPVKKTTITLTQRGKELLQADIDYSSIAEQLTSDMLRDGSWKEKTFRSYDVQTGVPAITGGRRHPYREALNIIRDVYVAMGFTEMEGPWVETAFWCMDAMWIPQDHPARDEQDTFFIGQEGSIPEQFLERVQAVHEDGGDSGSRGHGSPWNPAIARQLILRTHSTSTTFRMFGKGIQNGKYFSIANVFRNEALDATHLAEFVQAEGFVVGDDLTLADLMGFIKEFYARLGIHKIRFKPTYNPYTEPSIEAHYFDEHRKKWYALINSGIFRPESLYPFNLKKTVIAWGMGASRVASLLNHKNNLRELVGPQNDVEWIATHVTPQPNLEN